MVTSISITDQNLGFQEVGKVIPYRKYAQF